jgi:hypothetical protein
MRGAGYAAAIAGGGRVFMRGAGYAAARDGGGNGFPIGAGYAAADGGGNGFPIGAGYAATAGGGNGFPIGAGYAAAIDGTIFIRGVVFAALAAAAETTKDAATRNLNVLRDRVIIICSFLAGRHHATRQLQR